MSELGLLDAGDTCWRLWQHCHRNKYPDDDFVLAVSGHDLDENAIAGLALPGCIRHGAYCRQPAFGRPDHASIGSLSRLAFFRYSRRRIPRALAPLLLDLRPARVVH